jgi:hypothetical protein
VDSNDWIPFLIKDISLMRDPNFAARRRECGRRRRVRVQVGVLREVLFQEVGLVRIPMLL